jgi:hypothetical protein
MVGALLIDWKGMPNEYMYYVVGIATIVAVFDALVDTVIKS